MDYIDFFVYWCSFERIGKIYFIKDIIIGGKVVFIQRVVLFRITWANNNIDVLYLVRKIFKGIDIHKNENHIIIALIFQNNKRNFNDSINFTKMTIKYKKKI